jgi:hypothetical protein
MKTLMKATSPRHVELFDADAGQKGGGCRAVIFILALLCKLPGLQPLGFFEI